MADPDARLADVAEPIRDATSDDAPTPARLVALLDELARPATTAELARRLGLHPNGVRAHLDALAREGAVTRERVAHGRGRPRDEWTLDPEAPVGDAPTGYAALGRWLVRALAEADADADVEATGRRIGRELIDADGPPGPALHAALAALGFRPRRAAAPDGHTRFCLHNCPYRDVVEADQPTVCGLHRGITLGMLDAAAPGARLTAFVAKDPHRAGCEIEVLGLDQRTGQAAGRAPA